MIRGKSNYNGENKSAEGENGRGERGEEDGTEKREVVKWKGIEIEKRGLNEEEVVLMEVEGI